MNAARWFALGILVLSGDAFAGVAFDLGPMDPWPLSTGELHVCFTGPKDPKLGLPQKDYDDLRKDAVDVLNATWGRIPGFDVTESCATADPSQLAMTLTNQESWGTCGSGKGAACVIGGSANNLESFRRVLVHEVGHGLGLHHEHQTPDAQPLCAREQTIHDGCQQCADDGKCSAQEYTDCFFGVAPSPGVVTLPASGDKSVAAAKDRQLQREPDVNAWVLTVYDPLSLMGYCQVDFGGAASSYSPTVYDLLAAEMLYSANRTYGLACGPGCLQTSTGVVISSSGTVVSEWIGRGARNVPMRVVGTSVDVDSVAGGQLPSGVSMLSYTFDDPWGNARQGSGTVERSDQGFTALVSSLAAR